MGDLAEKLQLEGARPSLARSLDLEGADAEDDGQPAPSRPPPQKTTSLEAAGRGFANIASMDLSDEMGGFGSWLAGQGAPTPRAVGRGVDAPADTRSEYEVGRDIDRELNETALAEHPAEYRGGQGAAFLSTAALPLGNAARGASLGMRAVQAAKVAAPMGAVAGFGASEDPTSAGVAFDALEGAGAGAVLGTAAGEAAPPIARAIGKGLSAVGGKVGKTLTDVADRQLLAAGGAERAATKKLAQRSGGIRRYAAGMERQGIGEGAIPKTTRGFLEDAERALSETQAKKAEIVQRIEGSGAMLDGAAVGEKIRALAKGRGTGPAGKAMRDEIEGIAADFDAMGEGVSWAEMNAERMDWGDATNFDAQSVRGKLRKRVYGLLNEAMGEAADAQGDELGTAWRAANEDEHVALQIKELAENKLNSSGNRVVSLTDTIVGAGAGGGALAAGADPFTAAATGIALNRGVRNREHAIAAKLARAGAGAGQAVQRTGEQIRTYPVGVPARGARNVAAEGAGFGAAAMGPSHAAAQDGADRGTDDPKYGRMLASKSREERNVAYSVLMQTDPEFRARQRERARQLEEQEDQSTEE